MKLAMLIIYVYFIDNMENLWIMDEIHRLQDLADMTFRSYSFQEKIA